MNKIKHTKQWLAIRFPQLPLDVFAPDSDQAVITTQNHLVFCSNTQAQNLGIDRGMATATAQMLTACQILERDMPLEQAAIHQLANTLYDYTPYIEKQSPNRHTDSGLIIEVSQSIKLFKGLPNIITLITQELSLCGYAFHIGVGHTDKAAWLLSLDEPTEPTAQREQVLAQLARLPVTQLRLCPQTTMSHKTLISHLAALDKSGFNDLGDVMRQIEEHSLADFRQRWGENFARLLGDTLGIDHHLQQTCLFEKPQETYQPEDSFSDSIQFEYPVANSTQLEQPMEILLQNLSQYLTRRQRQCQKITWTLLDIYHNKQSLVIHTSENQHHGSLLLELSQIQLQAQQLAFEVDTLELQCRDTTPLQATTHSLRFQGHNNDKTQHDFALTTAKLKARLGDGALFKISYADSHLPEHSHHIVGINHQHNETLPATHRYALRPSWLFHKPLAVQLKQQQLYWRGKLELLQGPERIEGNWWHEPSARDYFMAQRDDYLRLWVFYDLHKNTWFVQGVFG